MAIIQISKIQQRSGNLVDLPQLDEAQLGWANDAKRLFIGTTTPNPNENVEVLTSYSNITFSQINGSEGNLNITSATNGEVLAYDGTNWVNKGGSAGGEINLGNVSNVTINGGAIGYVLETDGLGNLSWTPKTTVTAYISNVSKANPGVVTTTQDNFFTEGAQITITDVNGMTQLNGNSYYVNILTSNTFSLYSDSGLTTPVNTTGYGTYTSNGRAISSVGGSGSATAGGSNTTIQFNDNNIIQGNAGFTFDKVTGAVAIPGNITVVNGNLGNLATANYFSGVLTTAAQPNITSTGTLASLSVTANANVGNLNTSGLITATGNIGGGNINTAGLITATGNIRGANLITTGVISATGNANVGNIGATGGIFTTVTGTLTTAAQPNVTSLGTLTSVSVSGNANIGNIGTAGLITATGNIGGGNLVTAGLITATGNVTGGNLVTTGLVTVTGNVLAGNVYANSGIVKGQYLYGDGSNITNLNISAGSTIVNGTSNVSIPSSGGNVNAVVAGNTTLVVTGTGANISGTVSVSGNANVGNLGTGGLITATGNVTGGNLVTTGLVTSTGNVTGGNINTGGLVSATGNVTANNVVTTKYLINSIQTSISAAGSTQGTGTALASTINIVSTVASGAGVVLPTAVAGMTVYITNTSANSLLVYPASGATINELSTNAALTQVTKATLHYVAASSTQWYSVGATYA